jgi:putative transposase
MVVVSDKPRSVYYKVLAAGEIYHVFNRAVGRETVFSNFWGIKRAIELIDYYRFAQNISFSGFRLLKLEEKEKYVLLVRKESPLVEIYSYTFMPNHYHLLLKQLQENGIKTFISNFQNSFAKSFNERQDRHGTLFQTPYRARHIATTEQFLHVSRYIHINPVVAHILPLKDLFSDPRTSFPYYASNVETDLVNTKPILDIIGSRKKYIEFVSDQVDYQEKLHIIEGVIIDD